MRRKFLLKVMILSLLFVAMGGGHLFAQELLVNCDYNSSTEGYGTTKFSNYAGAYAYATANAKTATIVIEKTNTLSGNCFDNNHKNYSNLKVVIKDGAAMGNAASKWDMTYPVTVEPGGTLTCARPKTASVSYIHIKNTLTVGAEGSDKKAYVDFLSDTYQDCDISIRYNGKINVYNSVFKVQDLDAQGTLTIVDSEVTVDGAFASATFFATTLTNTTMTVNGNQISGGLSDFAGGDSNQLGKVTLIDSSITIENGDTKVAANVTATNSNIDVNSLTINSGKKLILNEGSALMAETIVNNGGTVTIDGVEATIEDNVLYYPVADFNALKAAVEAGKGVKLTADIIATGAVDGTDANIDLNEKTLTLSVGGNNFFGDSKVKNGSINITGCVASGDCIIGIGDYSKSATLTFDNVNVTGDGYSSAYAVLYVYNSSELNINGGSVVVSNDNASTGGVIKAHKAADGIINIVGTEGDPVELTFNNAKIGMLDGTVLMNYVDLDITDGANAINQSALTIKNSTLDITGADGRALTLSQGDVVVENSTLNFSDCSEGEIRFKKSLELTTDNTSTINECTTYADASATDAKINGVDVDASESSMAVVTVENGTTTVKEAPQGNDFTGYTSTDNAIWGETWGNAYESFVIKVLDANGNVMGTTSLNNIDGIIDGDVNVTWSLKLNAASNTDGYWAMSWTTAPYINNMPAKVELWVDGVKVSGGNVVLNGPDEINKIYAAVTYNDGKIYSYHTSIANAVDAITGTRSAEQPNVIALLRHTDETVTLPAGITLNLNGFTAANVSVPVAQIGETPYYTLAEAVAAAQDKDVIEIIKEGNYTLPEFAGKELTFKGSSRTGTSITDWVNKGSQGMMGSTVHFENLTISGQTENYYGLFHTNAVTYKDCDINGLRFLYSPTTFEDCAFNANGVEHSFWTYGASNVTVTGCTFTYTDRAVNCYSENGADHVLNITFTGCTFTYAGTNDAPEGAVEINSGNAKSFEIAFTDCTAPEKGAMWFNSTWDSADGAKTEVKVDEVVVWTAPAKIGETKYATLAAAYEAAVNGDVIVLNESVTTFPVIEKAVTFKGGKENAAVEINYALSQNFTAIDGIVRFENLTFNKPLFTEHGGNKPGLSIEFEGCNFNVNSEAGYGILIGTSYSNSVVKGLKVNNCNFKYVGTEFKGGYMLYVQCVNEVTITNNTIDGNNLYRGAIHLGDATEHATVATVSNNTIKNFCRGVMMGNRKAPSSATISGNTFDNINYSDKDNKPAQECAPIFIHSNATAEALQIALTDNEVENCANPMIYSEDTDLIKYYVTEFTGNTIAGAAVELANSYYAPNQIFPVATINDAEYFTLQAAIDAVQNGETIELLSDVTENVTLTEATDLYYTINGSDKTMNGKITVTSLSDTNDNRRITIKNIKFVDNTDANVDFISSVNTNHYPRLTISGCDFTGSGNDGDVAIRLKSSHSVVIEDCTGTGLHSFLQNTSGWNLTINKVTVTESKGGLALGTVQGVTVKDSNIDVNGYGIRLDADTYNNNAVIESCTVNAFIPVVVRKVNTASSVTFNGTNTMTQTNTDGLWCAIGKGEYENNGEMPEAPATGQVTVTLNGTGLSMDGVYGAFFPVKIGETGYATLAAAAAAAQAGDEILLLADVTLSEELTTPAGITLNGNGKQINGSIVAGGDLTIKGHTKATSFNAGYNQPIITIGAGACLEMNGADRMVIGHGATFNITGTIAEAKTANVAELTPSLIMPGASFTGAGVTFNVTNAYINAPSSYCSSSKSASGTFVFKFDNSIWESAGKLAFESQSTAATVNFELKDSKLTTGSHLVFGVSRGEVVFDNSNVNVGTSRQIENQSTMTVKNGSVVNGAVATSSNAKNPGTLIVDNATYAVTGEFSGSDLGTGTLIVNKTANFSAGSITKANIQIDVTGMNAGDEVNITTNLTNHAGTIEVINNNMLDAKIVDGKIVIVERTLQGEGTEANPYLINDVDDLVWLQAKVDESAQDGSTQFAGKYFKLTNDIDLSGINWNPIGTMSADHGSFKGVFDGGDHTISNLYVEQAGDGIGLFARTTGNAVIKNLKLNNVTVKSTNNSNYVGGLVGNAYASTKIENVHVSGNVYISGRGYIGGIAGHGYVVMDNVSVVATGDGQGNAKGLITSTFWCAGGVLGYAGEGATNIMNAHVKNVVVTSAAGGLGAIVGMAEDNDGTQPISGSNLSAENVEIKTYTGAYGDAYANYALGYLYGGNPTSILTGDLSVEEVIIETSTGEDPEVNDAVAKIGNSIYFNLQAALNAGGNITIIRDIALTDGVTVPADKTVVLDLNGKTISQTKEQTTGYQMILNDGNLTIKDSSNPSTGKISYTDSGNGGEYISDVIYNRATLVIDGGTIENLSSATVATNGYPHAVDTYSGIRDTYVEINGGTIYCAEYSAVRMFCVSATNKADLVINGGTIKGAIDMQNGTKVAALGTLTINDGTFETTKNDNNIRFANWNGGATEYGISAEIKGGSFNGGITTQYVPAAANWNKGIISGGTFAKDMTEYCAPGFKVEENGDGTYGVVPFEEQEYVIDANGEIKTFADAIAKAKEDGVDIVTYIIKGAATLETGYSHGIVDFGGVAGYITIQGGSDNTRGTAEDSFTITGGGVPDIKGVTFKDLTFYDEGEYLPTANEFMYQNFIDCKFENVKFEDGIRLSGNSVVRNCTFNANTNDEYAIWLDEGTFEMTGSTVTAGNDAYGLLKSDEVDKITISDNTFQYLAKVNKEALNVKNAIIVAEDNTFIDCAKGVVPTDKTNYTEDGETIITNEIIAVNNTVVVYVAKINDTKYQSLAEAATAAQDGETIELLWAEGHAPISMAATIVNNKTVTITGTADVDWDKDWLYVGRNGEGNGKLIFNEANLTSKSVGVKTNGIGLNVSCKKVKEGEYTTNDGEVEIIDSNIQLDYLIGKGNIKLDNSTLEVYEGFAVGARPASETGGVQRTVTMDITNGSNVIVDNHNGQGLGHESNGIMNIDATSTFETQRSFLITANGTMNNAGTVEITGTLTNNGDINFTALTAKLTAQGGLTIVDQVNNPNYAIAYLDGTYQYAEYVAQIGDEKYLTLQEAVEAAQNDETITLLVDVEQTDGVIIDSKNIVVDLNEKTFTVTKGANTSNRNFKIKGTSVVTIKNGTMVAAGNYDSGAYGTVRTEGTAKVTLTGLKLYNYRGNGLNIKVLANTEVAIDNTEIYSEYGGGIEAAGGTINIAETVKVEQKGMYTAPYNSMAISVNGGGTVIVEGGTYSTECITAEEANGQGTSHGPWVVGVLNSGGTLIINGGTFSNDNFGDNSLATNARGAVLADTGAEIEINGGTFNALKAIIDIQNNLGDANNNPSALLSGGTFSADPRNSAMYGSNLIVVADGYIVVDNGNGTYSVVEDQVAKIGDKTYKFLHEAFDAAQDGDEIVVLKDITLTEGIVIPADKTVTLDLAGCTVKQEKAQTEGYAMITNVGTLTIKDSSNPSTGKLSYKDTGDGGDGSFASNTIQNHGHLTILGGRIENLSEGQVVEVGYPHAIDHGNYSTVYTVEDVTLDIQGGTISNAHYSAIRMFCNSTTYRCDATISGGTIENAIDFQLPNAGKLLGSLTITGGTFNNINGKTTSVRMFAAGNANDGTGMIASIEGGTFNGTVGVITQLPVPQSFNTKVIKGGKFSATAAQNTSEDFLAEGFAFNDTPDANGYYTVIQTAGTQTREFAYPGWYWFSTYIQFENGEEGLDELQEQLDDNAATIKGQTAFTNYQTYNGNNFWTSGNNSLTSISASDMYMIKTTNEVIDEENDVYEVVTVSLDGGFVDYENYEITLKKGWNWIGYPLNTEVNVKDALAGFTPENGDQIKGKAQGRTSTYMSVLGGWFPDFEMIPGEGYMYLSNALDNKSLFYKGENRNGQNVKTSIENNHWIVDEYKYPNNMTVTAMLSIDGEIVKDNYEVAAFANGECRGSARPIYIEALDAYMLFMTIQGEDVENLTFKYYDVNYGTEYELNNTMVYSNDAIVGTIEEPYMFNLGILNIEETSVDQISIYPNPTTTGKEINLQAVCDKVEVFSALGVKVAEYTNVDSIDALETAGIYVIRVTIDGNARNCRLIVK